MCVNVFLDYLPSLHRSILSNLVNLGSELFHHVDSEPVPADLLSVKGYQQIG